MPTDVPLSLGRRYSFTSFRQSRAPAVGAPQSTSWQDDDQSGDGQPAETPSAHRRRGSAVQSANDTGSFYRATSVSKRTPPATRSPPLEHEGLRQSFFENITMVDGGVDDEYRRHGSIQMVVPMRNGSGRAAGGRKGLVLKETFGSK